MEKAHAPEQHHCKPAHALDGPQHPSQQAAARGDVRPVHVGLAKCKHGHDGCARLQGHVHEAAPLARQRVVRAGCGHQRLCRTARHQQHALARAPRERVPDGALAGGQQAVGQDVLAQQRHPEVGLERAAVHVDAWEGAGEAGGVSGKVDPAADRAQAVGHHGEYVVAVRWQLGGAHEARAEVARHVRPCRPFLEHRLPERDPLVSDCVLPPRS
mmetsp:Transcript_10668/g.26346  ORF Transcript_10668/g.26346 Transcript_10668/m.26346 type:complete len:214 (-) Transcript_10668:357-998(-)